MIYISLQGAAPLMHSAEATGRLGALRPTWLRRCRNSVLPQVWTVCPDRRASTQPSCAALARTLAVLNLLNARRSRALVLRSSVTDGRTISTLSLVATCKG